MILRGVVRLRHMRQGDDGSAGCVGCCAGCALDGINKWLRAGCGEFGKFGNWAEVDGRCEGFARSEAVNPRVVCRGRFRGSVDRRGRSSM